MKNAEECQVGMFDYIKIDKSIKIPAPKDFKLQVDLHDLEYQTKDLENCLFVYTMTRNKTIYQEDKKIKCHGEFNFGSFHSTDLIDYCFDYKAKFTDGKLQNIKLVKYEEFAHESNVKKKEEFLKRIKKDENRISRKLLIFIQNNLIVSPLNLFGCKLKSFRPGFFHNEKVYVNFCCPKISLGYRRSHRAEQVFGISFDEITTEFCLKKAPYKTDICFRILGFGIIVSINRFDLFEKDLEDKQENKK